MSSLKDRQRHHLPPHCTPHGPSGGWRYKRMVPLDLQDVAGFAFWRSYVSTMDGKSQAEATARQLEASQTDWIAAVRLMSADQRAAVKAAGGAAKLGAIRARADLFASQRARLALMDPRRTFADMETIGGLEGVANAGELALLKSDHLDAMARAEAFARHQANILEAVQLKALPVAEHTLAGLLALWIKAREPKCTGEHKATVKLFIELCGDLDYRHVTAADVQRFRDAIDVPERSKKNQTRQLERLSALFAVAVSEGKMLSGLNPVRGIAVRGKDPRAAMITQQPLSGAQTALVLSRAEATGWGAERAGAALWALRVLAWTGARPNEVLQLQRGDVGMVDGVPCIRIRATCAVTGKAHALKSVKNGESVRIVPLHPSIAAGFQAFAAGDAAGFVFGAFPHNAQKGRAHWFALNFGAFLRDCGIVAANATERVSLYSLRHGFKGAMKRARIAEDNRKMIMGHSSGDVHGRYGGDDLSVLAADVARVDVLSD